MENNTENTEKTELVENKESQIEIVEDNDETLHKPGSYDPVKEAKGKILFFVIVVAVLVIAKYVFNI